MWAHQEDLPHRAGKGLESDLSLRYLAPGAFTILPPGKEGPPPDSATNKHRLTPTTKTHRNAAFTIIAEPESNAGSRSPSPTGRVSPFRGRGFNPTGSRHASPLPSPPPEERGFPSSRNNQSDAAKRSKIPTLSRRGSTAELFGENVDTAAISPGRTRKRTTLTKQLSQSLTNISPKHVSYKPPPSPRRTGRAKKPTAFPKLSPIIGSSPEPTPDPHRLQPQSSSTKIPRSRSQPPSARISPNVSRVTSRVNSRNPSRNASRNPSREPSPNRLNPKTNYKNVKAKVNSYNAVKPKVPPKPQVPKTNEKHKLERKESVIRSNRANDNNSNKDDSTSNASSSKNSKSNSSKNEDSKNSKSRNKSASPSTSSKGSTSRTNRKAGIKSELEDVQDVDDLSSRASSPDNESSPVIENSKTRAPGNEKKNAERTPKLVDLLAPSTTAVVSSTTTTVTQPLKIEAKLDASKDDDKGDNTMYLPDARALSATSVSTAMNRMNDTVLDTKTLMKETNLSSRLSPAATTIISMSNTENNSQKQSETVTSTETKNSGLPPVETVGRNNNNNNHNDPFGPEVTHNFGNSNVSSLNPNNNSVTMDVKSNDTNGKSNGISPERGVVGLSALPKSENERIKEARTMVATDVQPIRITVKEKPSDSEVQSGNVRLPVSATNGISERPGLPPSQPPPEEPPATPEPPKGCCGRFLGCCKKKSKAGAPREAEKKKRVWCCSKSKKVEKMQDRVNSDASLLEEEANQKMKWWKKLKCCRRKKVGDTTGCFPSAQRKESWAERTDSITSEIVKKSPKDKCKHFLRTIFCINLCSRKRRKEQEEAINRRASLMSKKKSLTPPVAPEEHPKLDAGLVEHTSLMKGAIPVLPVPLAWMCLILNVFLPGTGTIISGFLCLCMGKPRFSTKDGMKQRAGACFIDFFIGCGQLFTVLFCLVGWGWSIWWGVIMIKIAKKYRKIRRAEKAMEDDTRAAAQAANENHTQRDPERGS